MEELEQKKLDAYEAKKSLEKSRREAKKVAHQKVVSRSVAKTFNQGLKFNTLVLLKDIGYFSDPFKEEVLDAQVLPWLFEQTEKFVNEGAAFNSYPNTIVASHIEDKSAHHVKKVEEHRKLLADRRQAAEDAAAQKKAEKLARREERERLRKEAERKELENKIEKAFIEPHQSVTEVAAVNIIEIDGWNHSQKQHIVTAIGGFFGQLITILNTVAHYYPQLDRSVKSGKSGRSKPPASRGETDADKESKAASQAAADDVLSEKEIPRNILNASVVQNFIYTYINEKLKGEEPTLDLFVDGRFEKFLNDLPQPLQLNEIRSLKDDKTT